MILGRCHFSASNLIPGPNSTELAIHLGYKRAGWLGLLTAGICFIGPAMLIVWAFAALYKHYQYMPQLSSLMYGVKPVIIAIVLQALWNLSHSVVKSKFIGFLAVGTVLFSLLSLNEILLLLVSGILSMLVVNRSKLYVRKPMSVILPLPWLFITEPAPIAAAKMGVLSLSSLFWVFVKIGSVLYGSGYVLLVFLQSEFVNRLAVLTPQQLIDAVAVGQFTPGPVFTTATFVGYLIYGNYGAVLATIGIFLPAFVFGLIALCCGFKIYSITDTRKKL